MALLLLSLVVVAFGLLQLHHRRITRQQWEKLEGIINALNSGRRPPSFIFHGEPVWHRLGLGLETLADERDRLQQQVYEEEFNLQSVLASVDEGVAIVDLERRIRLVNRAFLRLFSLRGNPAGGTLLQTLRDASIEETVREAMAKGKPVAREVVAGSLVLLVNACPMQQRAEPGGKEEFLGCTLIFRDITRVTQLEQVRRDFVANVSHELRTPLSIFQGYVEMLLDAPDDLPPAELRATLDILQKHSRRLNLLVEDLLSIARLESRREPLQLEPVPIEGVLKEMALDWSLKFAGRNVRFHAHLAHGLPSVMASAPRLEQILNNLFENALNYTPEGGEVLLEAELSSNEDGAEVVEVRVRDTGSGIPAKDLPHIFERFYRADKARQRGQGGTGLGLSIVKHLVQAHGGSVGAESLPGRGTTIAFRLPALTSVQ